MKKVFSIVFVAMLAVACGTQPDLTQVTEGMSSAQVEQTVGKAKEVRQMPFGIEWWLYGDNGVVVLSEGEVVKVSTDMRGDIQRMDDAMEEGAKELEELLNAQ